MNCYNKNQKGLLVVVVSMVGCCRSLFGYMVACCFNGGLLFQCLFVVVSIVVRCSCFNGCLLLLLQWLFLVVSMVVCCCFNGIVVVSVVAS